MAEIKRDTRGMTPEQRFELFADTSGGPEACHPWTGPKINRHGYGAISVGNKRRICAHRWVVGHVLGRELETHEEVLHSCDNPPCVNPLHLRVGTHLENVADMYAKGRNVPWQSLKTECVRGHQLSGDNLRYDERGARQCVACGRMRARKYMAAKRERLRAEQ